MILAALFVRPRRCTLLAAPRSIGLSPGPATTRSSGTRMIDRPKSRWDESGEASAFPDPDP